MDVIFQSWNQLKKVLAIRLDAMGDVFMTEPALRALKQSLPNASLSLLTSVSGAEAGRLMTSVDQVIVYDPPWMKAAGFRENSNQDRQMADFLKGQQFDAAVIFTVYSQNPLPGAMLAYWADVPKRLAHCRENPYQLLTHWVPDPEPQVKIRHEVQRQLDLVSTVGCKLKDERIQIQLLCEAKLRAAHRLAQVGVNLKKPFLTVHTGATAQSRRYPPEKFVMMIQKLIQIQDLQIVLTGTESERPVIDFISREAGRNCFPLIGVLNLAEFAALLQASSLLISNNTGAVHVAAGVGTPVVVLYALTNPQHTPWQVKSRILFEDVPCKFCYRSVCPEGHNRCLRDIDPEKIVEAAFDLLSKEKCPMEDFLYA